MQSRKGETMKNITETADPNHFQKLHDAVSATIRQDAPPEEEAHLWVKGILETDNVDGTTSRVPMWTRKAEQEAWERARFPALFSETPAGQALLPTDEEDAEETMIQTEDDEDWNAADYDDEPRSGGNFGMDVQAQQSAEACAVRAECFRAAEANYRLSGLDPDKNEHYQRTKSRVISGEFSWEQAIRLAVEHHTWINRGDDLTVFDSASKTTDPNGNPYCYPGTDVLQNKMNIRAKHALAVAETEIGIYTNARLLAHPEQ